MELLRILYTLKREKVRKLLCVIFFCLFLIFVFFFVFLFFSFSDFFLFTAAEEYTWRFFQSKLILSVLLGMGGHVWP